MDAQDFLEFEKLYIQAAKEGGQAEKQSRLLLQTLLKLSSITYNFPIYHEKHEHPIDYYSFGMRFIEPLIDKKRSKLFGKEAIEEAVALIKQGENVVFLSNHQTEPDPQCIDFMLREHFPTLGKEMIFIAGHKVTQDPMAIPFSMGRNLLCIYSKKYLETPPERKTEKVQHNQKTMKKLLSLLNLGGKAIYIAPAAGRDRMNKNGEVPPAPFYPESIEMFRFLAKHAGKKTHFFPMAIYTYDLFPPPIEQTVSLGEKRIAKRAPIYLSVGPEIHFDALLKKEGDKQAQREEATQLAFSRMLFEMERILAEKKAS